VYKKLNSTETLIQRTTREAPQQTYVLHRARRSQEDHQLLREGCKRADSAGRDDSSESYGAGQLDEPWIAAMEASIFTGQGGASLDAARYRRFQEEERQD